MTFKALVVTGVLLLVFCSQLLADDPASANREIIVHILRAVAMKAQLYYHTPASEHGGGGSFATLGLNQLVLIPATAYGYVVLTSPRATSVTLTGVGRELGYDGSNLVEVEIIVYPDSVNMTIIN